MEKIYQLFNLKWIYLTAGQRWIIDGQSQLWQWGGRGL